MIVIGAGRVGQALASRDPQLRLLSRGGPWSALEEAAGEAIVVATRNDDLRAVIDRVPEARHPDLVFVQNGMLRDFVAAAGLPRVTRGLLFFAVPKRGDDLTPGGVSPFWGPRAGEVVAWCDAHDIAAAEVEASAFAELELEKLVWNSCFGLLCEALNASVGELVKAHRPAVDALVLELASLGAGAMDLELSQLDLPAMAERCCQYSESIPAYRGAVKEWEWRNGWFVARGRELAVASPEHERWLEKVGRA